VSDARQSFWTTLPGILTGLAALITALVGLAALFLGRGEGSPATSAENPAVTDRGSAATPADSGAGEPAGGQGAVMSSVELQLGESVDVDTGLIGSNVSGELVWISNQLNLYGRRNAVVPAATDEAGCRAALERRSDGWLTADQLAGGAVVCLSTDEGALAQARVSAPDVTDRITVDLTVWPA
jgi:hypothetical protein